MDVAAGANDLVKVVALLGAAVVMVPLFRHLGLGSVLGYLAAGLAIGPFGLGWFAHPEQVLHVAELGVVMFLFVIGLEMKPAHLWSLRQQIFGLGTAQIATCTVLLTGVGIAFGFPPATAFIAGMGFVMTSTAIVMQQLAERGDIALPNGQKIVSILLFEDLLIVPLLLLVAFMAPGAAPDAGLELKPVLVALASLAGVVVAGIWLLNPLFRVLAAARAREVMTAAALLVVLGAALLMQVGGLSMAMGAFLAGVLLSGSTFRHQIEADIEPFRGILLGLFFLGVGMALDLSVVGKNAALVILGVLVLMLAKASAIYVVARLMRSRHAEALDRAVLMAQGGEFAFVLFAAAAQAHVIDGQARASMTAIVVLSMVLTPVLVLLARRFSPSLRPSLDGIDVAQGLSGSVLIVGFGRFGQVASQSLLARGVDVTIIDRDVDMIRNATRFGFKVYYGDGTRLDVLHACGAASARAIAVCVNDRAAASRIAELAKQHFPQARLLVRSYDREHSLELAAHGIDLHVRETFESAMRFGEMALRALDVPAVEAAAIAEEVRRRDAERFQIERVGGYGAGRDLLHVNAPRPTPTPLTAPRRGAQALNKDAEEAALPAAAVPVAEAALPAAAPTVAEAALPAVAPTVAAAAIPSPPPPAVPAAASSADPAADEPVAAPGEPPRGS